MEHILISIAFWAVVLGVCAITVLSQMWCGSPKTWTARQIIASQEKETQRIIDAIRKR
jgi:hypothetical protein